MTRIAHNRDILSVVLATLAIGLSAWTALTSRRCRKQETFLRVHELLITSEVRRGRKLHYEGARGVSHRDQ